MGMITPEYSSAGTTVTIDRFDVMTPDETVPGYALSGGNQQKLLVGRELDSEPSVLVAAHPTRGVDVGAQATIWAHLREERDAGLAVLLITADLEELIALSDRIIVMFDGRVTAELATSEATPDVLEGWRVPVIPRHVAGADEDLLTGEFSRHPVGCGAFRFFDIMNANNVRAVKNGCGDGCECSFQSFLWRQLQYVADK